jgi:hypothetical protein
METGLKWGLRFFIAIGFISFFEVGLASAASLTPPSPKEQTLEGAMERFGHAPWIFLGEVQSVEIVTDSFTPSSVFPRWQAQHTRFRVIHGIKGPFQEGYEVELKECAPRPTPSHSLCGTLYSRAPDLQIGTIFLVVTGPGNPNVYQYQTSIRLPATRVPVLLKADPIPGKPHLEEIMEDDFSGMPLSESGWLIDFSGFTTHREEKMPKEKSERRSQEESAAGDVPGAKGKASATADKKEPLRRNPGSVDLNQFKKQLEK